MTRQADHIPYEGRVREPSADPEADRHDCLFCGAYVLTECVKCGADILSNEPGNDAFNRLMVICYECELGFIEDWPVLPPNARRVGWPY